MSSSGATNHWSFKPSLAEISTPRLTSFLMEETHPRQRDMEDWPYLIHGMDAALRRFPAMVPEVPKPYLQEKELVLPITTTPGEKVWFPEAVVPVAAPSRAQEQEEVPSGSMQMVISILQAVHCSQLLEEKDEAMKIQNYPAEAVQVVLSISTLGIYIMRG